MWQMQAVASVLLAFLVIFVSSWLRKWWRRRKLGLPPGPTGWPLLGYLDFIFVDRPSHLLLKVKEKYGNVFGFYVGKWYCVVLSDFASVKEAYGRKAMLARPPGYLRTSPDCKNFVEMDYENWDTQRKFFVNCLKELGVGSTKFEEMIHDELSRVIPKLEMEVEKPECNFRPAISMSFNNIIFRMICSRWFEENHPAMITLNRFQTLIAESFSNNMAFIYFPWLDWLLNKFHPHYQAIGRSAADMSEVIRSEIVSREKIHNESSRHDYIDMYLNEVKSKKYDPEHFNESHLVANSTLMLMAASDTTRNTLEWAMLAMAQFPEIQKKVFYEIQSVIGTEKSPSYSDKTNLPYTEATIYESERWKTLVPLNALRWSTEDTVVQGYTIPQNTVVINNLYSCHMDPEYWKNPEEFIPERFLNKDQTKVVVPECFMPFSLGKRNCPGDKMASIEIFIYFTTVMQKFKLLPPPGGVCMSAKHRVNDQAERPVLKFIRR